MFIKNMISDKQFWKSTLLLAIPIAFQNLISTSFSLIDLLMMGKLGDETIAAVGLAGQISFLQNVFLFGICSGGMVFISQYWGAGNIAGIKRTYGIVLTNCIVIGLLFFSLSFFAPRLCMSFYTNDNAVIEIGVKYLKYVSFSYLGSSLIMGFSYVLRAMEQVWIPLFTNIFSVIANIFFNYALIYGNFGFAKMGVQGAAIATVISASLNPLLILFFSYLKKSILISPLKEIFSFNWNSLNDYYKITLPVFINEMLWALGMTMYNSIFGHMKNYAAMTISKTVENIVFVLFIGLCDACAVLIGKYVGLNKIKEVKEYSKRFLFLVPVLGLIVGIIVILIRGYVLSFFDISKEVRNLAYMLLLVFALQIGIRNISYICIVGIFRAGGDTKTGMYYDLLCLWFIGLPITYLCGSILKLDFVLVYIIMLLSEDTIKCILCLRHFLKMKWIKPIQQKIE